MTEFQNMYKSTLPAQKAKPLNEEYATHTCCVPCQPC